MFQDNNDNGDSLESNKDQDDGNSGGGMSTMYTYRRGEKRPEGQLSNQFGNSWNKEGCDCCCDLMLDINKSRAHFNQSFDKQMKIYAKCMTNKERNRQTQK